VYATYLLSAGYSGPVPAQPATPTGAPRSEDARLLDAAERVLRDVGWDAFSLERVAEAAGLSRVTAWRMGATKDGLINALVDRVALDYQAALWPVLTGRGDAAGRIRAGLFALCDVIDRHLPLLMSSDTVFHRDNTHALEFNAPFARLIADGIADRSVPPDTEPDDAACALFNTVCWSYVHLRARHRWGPKRARTAVTGLVLNGLLAPRE
jgi:AcrR family transcriptional regulator